MMKQIFALVPCTIFAAKAQETIRFNYPNEVLNFAKASDRIIEMADGRIFG